MCPMLILYDPNKHPVVSEDSTPRTVVTFGSVGSVGSDAFFSLMIRPTYPLAPQFSEGSIYIYTYIYIHIHMYIYMQTLYPDITLYIHIYIHN